MKNLVRKQSGGTVGEGYFPLFCLPWEKAKCAFGNKADLQQNFFATEQIIFFRTVYNIM